MTAIRLQFPASRYHANAWGRHVNEGVGEWPPSPYRLLRALFDTWKRKCQYLEEPIVESVLGALASEDPRFELPRATASHTRSYLSSNELDPTKKSLIFDGFVAFDSEAVCNLIWPNVELDGAQRQALAELLGCLNYLGRSESWVSAALGGSFENSGTSCAPAQDANVSGDIVQVAGVLSPAAYSGKQRWVDALTTSTSAMFKTRQSSPPLLRMVRYVRPIECMQNSPIARSKRRDPGAQAVMLALDSTVLPLMTATIEIGEQIRVRLMGAHRRRMGGDETRVSPLFSGKHNGGMRLDHGHVFILPLSNSDFRIDRVLLLSKLRPFTIDELDAVSGVEWLWQADDRPRVRCVMTWQGALDSAYIRTQAREVVSATPFVTVRHPRRETIDHFLEHEIRRECRNHGVREPWRVERVARPVGTFECVEYRRNRRDDPPRAGYALRLSFEQPVPAPFSLGYGSHFGLGQFV